MYWVNWNIKLLTYFIFQIFYKPDFINILLNKSNYSSFINQCKPLIFITKMCKPAYNTIRYCKFSFHYQWVFCFRKVYLLFSEIFFVAQRRFILYSYLNCTQITTLFNNRLNNKCTSNDKYRNILHKGS